MPKAPQSLIINSPLRNPASALAAGSRRLISQQNYERLEPVLTRNPLSVQRPPCVPGTPPKRTDLNYWIQGVNAKGGFGIWCWDMAFIPAQLQDILAKHASSS